MLSHVRLLFFVVDIIVRQRLFLGFGYRIEIFYADLNAIAHKIIILQRKYNNWATINSTRLAIASG